MLRRLRIAASVFIIVVTAALMGLWVRSYWRSDILYRLDKNNHVIGIGSEKGMVFLWPGHTVPPMPLTSGLQGWQLTIGKIESRPGSFQWGNFQWTVSAGITRINVPYWFITPLAAAAAFLPWVKQFSLRTMLIATTVLAVILSAAVIASR
jgi:hypothetical protein